MDDAAKVAVLKASICNLGRLLPEGMTITFRCDPGCMPTVEKEFPDGQVLTGVFRHRSPIYNVPVVPAEFAMPEDV